MNNKTLLILGAVLILVIGGIYFINLSSKQMQKPQTTTPEAVSNDAEEVTGTEFVVEGAGLKFTPNELRVKLGSKVKVTFKSTGGSHDFRLDEFNVATKVLSEGAQESVEFIADKAGSFEFYCSIPGHRAAGMKGTLVVE